MPATSLGLDVREDDRNAAELSWLTTVANVTFDARCGRRDRWMVASLEGRESVALRVRSRGQNGIATSCKGSREALHRTIPRPSAGNVYLRHERARG